MKITPLGKSPFEQSFITKMALDMITQSDTPSLDQFSEVKTDTHTILISKLGLLGDLPEGVNINMYTTPEVARNLQQWM